MKTITLNLDGTSREVRSDLWRAWLQPEPPEPEVQVQIQVDPRVPVRWDELSRLKELVELHYTGRDVGVIDYLAGRPSIRTFEWSGHGRSRIDLSRMPLQRALIDLPEGDFELSLPVTASLTQLTLSAPRSAQRVRVHAPENGAGLSVTILCKGRREPPGGIEGLEQARSLDLWSVDRVSLDNLGAFGGIEELILSGPRGEIADLENLARFRRLRRLRLHECYFLNPAAMPLPSALPALERVEIDGVRERDAVELLERLRGGPAVSIRGRRSDAWIRANLDHPFRHWEDEYSKALSSGAKSAFRKTATAFGRSDVTSDSAREAVSAYVAAFNRLDRKHPLDTLIREEIQGALEELIDTLPEHVDRDPLRACFEENREF